LALTLYVGLATSPKAQASSSAKVYFKQYKETKKFAHDLTASFSYQLPQLKGNSAAIKKINRVLQKDYKNELNSKENMYTQADSDAESEENLDIPKRHNNVKTNVTYNKNNIVSIRRYQKVNTNGLENIDIGGWTFSLKTGKSLRLYDVTKESRSTVNKKLKDKYFEMGADKSYIKMHGLANLPFFIKKGKVYAYTEFTFVSYRHPAVFTSRYK
ncbi:hypothetical protein, partial [Lactobacillus delbrueckii]|uniref:hypothetical protein n=1 Tax=Lactobacillus delbrueckii TaxID=1584 RepID=UPI0039938A4E